MKRKAVFLDRDGVLVKEKGYINRFDDLELFSFTTQCIKQIHDYGYLAIVITNQSAIAKGILDIHELSKMHTFLKEYAGVDDVFFCPHSGQEKILCNCRKPSTGLVDEAIALYNISRSGSYFVGDRASDIETGINSRLTTVLLESGYGLKRLEKQIHADYYGMDLKDFTANILIPVN